MRLAATQAAERVRTKERLRVVGITDERKRNPHDICTWHAVSTCAGCDLAGRLNCRFRWTDLAHFLGMFLVFALPAVIGVIRGGNGAALWGWLGFSIVFFGFWEIRILCSHCPYYAEQGHTLHCIANYGCPKVWTYRPGPISRSEKMQLLIGFVILGGYPFLFLILGRQYAFTAIALWGLVMFFWSLRKHVCSRCINFSCVLNTVPKEIVDAYLQRNPTMRKAWEQCG
jgi:hypothetical protein